ncbi:MAG: hypothetical protein KJ000_33305 [Pirellulaceae bacterium]|nr:hypothetical protein [Pirellulaceae bacterium]
MRRFCEVQFVPRLLIAVLVATSFIPPTSLGAVSHGQCRAMQCACGCCSQPGETLPPCCAAEKTAPRCCCAAPDKPTVPQPRTPSSEWREWTGVLAVLSPEPGMVRPGDGTSLTKWELVADVCYLPEPCVLCRWRN